MTQNTNEYQELTTPREIIAALRKPGRAYMSSNTLGGVSIEVVKADVIAELKAFKQDEPLANEQYVLVFTDGTVVL